MFHVKQRFLPADESSSEEAGAQRRTHVTACERGGASECDGGGRSRSDYRQSARREGPPTSVASRSPANQANAPLRPEELKQRLTA